MIGTEYVRISRIRPSTVPLGSRAGSLNGLSDKSTHTHSIGQPNQPSNLRNTASFYVKRLRRERIQGGYTIIYCVLEPGHPSCCAGKKAASTGKHLANFHPRRPKSTDYSTVGGARRPCASQSYTHLTLQASKNDEQYGTSLRVSRNQFALTRKADVVAGVQALQLPQLAKLRRNSACSPHPQRREKQHGHDCGDGRQDVQT